MIQKNICNSSTQSTKYTHCCNPGVKWPRHGGDNAPLLFLRLCMDRAIPLPPLFAFTACCRVTFTYFCTIGVFVKP